MLSFLEKIWHGILEIPYLVINLLIEAINGWLVLLYAAAEVLVKALPGFPATPEAPEGVIGAVLWFFPIVSLLAVLSTVGALWLTWLGIRFALTRLGFFA